MKINKAVLILAVILSSILLYVLGSLHRIIFYESIKLAFAKLLIINSLIFVSIITASYYLIFEFKKHFLSRVIIVSQFCIFLILYFVIFAFNNRSSGPVGVGYMEVGDFLRDFHGINIYFMDSSGWIITLVLYSATISTALGMLVLNKFIKK